MHLFRGKQRNRDAEKFNKFTAEVDGHFHQSKSKQKEILQHNDLIQSQVEKRMNVIRNR